MARWVLPVLVGPSTAPESSARPKLCGGEFAGEPGPALRQREALRAAAPEEATVTFVASITSWPICVATAIL
jgi:hypothetical protein